MISVLRKEPLRIAAALFMYKYILNYLDCLTLLGFIAIMYDD